MELDNQFIYDTIIIGGGQSALSCGYFMRRTGLNYLILDEQEAAGGAWNHTWDSLKLFSPAEHSSLPGWMMPKDKTEYPGKSHVISYLKAYEDRYKLPVVRPVLVNEVIKSGDLFELQSSKGTIRSKSIISATGTWKKPYIPEIEGRKKFTGLQLHSASYKNPDSIAGDKVLIVGGGNSGAQLLAEISKTHKTTWVTLNEPTFLPDEVDGRYLFEFATRQYQAKLRGEKIKPVGSLGDVVMVDTVKEARDRGVLISKRPFKSIFEQGVIWEDDTKETFDTILWCTGFKSSLDHLKMFMDSTGKIKTELTRSVDHPGLWLVGYGSWTGYASATLIGVGRTARQTVREVESYIKA